MGYDHIASQLSIIAASLGMEVYFYDIENKLPLGNAKQLHTLEELLGSCDVISLQVPDLPSPLSSVNFSEVSLPEHVDTKRLLHIHENRPGVLNKLNQIFVEANINIAAQYLQTDPKTGYVVVDVETDYSSPLLAKLREIEGTIKARVLY